MDIATVGGLILGTLAIVGSMLTSGSIMMYVDVASLLVVGGGVIASTFIRWPLDIVLLVAKVAMKTIFSPSINYKDTIDEIGKLAETARRESIFALEKAPVEDPFLKKAMLLAADNRPPEVISAILLMEIEAMEGRHKIGIDLMDGLAGDGPSFGMIGTLLGLVAMLKNMSDPSAIGPAMAVALLTTLYGAILANLFCNPFKGKLTQRSTQEATKMNIIIAGTLGIVAGENPRLIREKLNAFLPPKDRAVEQTE